jgi:hypothetical protein
MWLARRQGRTPRRLPVMVMVLDNAIFYKMKIRKSSNVRDAPPVGVFFLGIDFLSVFVRNIMCDTL